jgi:chitodextrinase
MWTLDKRLAHVTAMGLALSVGAASTALAARDRTPPSAPRNLRVTATGPYSVTLAWDASRDNVGVASYHICCANTNSQIAPGNVTTFVYTAGLEHLRTFSLRMYAVDAAGNYSKPSNDVTFTLPRDTVPPSKPVLSITGTGIRHVSLTWSATDNGPNVWYSLFANGNRVLYVTRDTSATLTLLQAATEYTFTVEARDFAGLTSPLSDPDTTTTAPINPDDVTPPATPGNLRADDWGDCEVDLDWDESTDDFDPQFVIEYQIFVNDVYDHSLSLRYTRTVVYGTQPFNTFAVVAVDTAGNRSDPATVTRTLNCSP